MNSINENRLQVNWGVCQESGKKETEAKGELKNPRLKRYDLNKKIEFIEYMRNREKSEEKSNATGYAEREGVSRTTLYNLHRQFEEEFIGKRTGPRPGGLERLADRIEEQEQEQYERLKGTLGTKEERFSANEEKIIRMILQAGVSPMSAREIRDLVEATFKVRISKRRIKSIIGEYAHKARKILEEMGLEAMVEEMAIDEVFCGAKPVLTGVDLNSFAVVICEKEDIRTHEVWHKILNLFPNLRLVTSDRAKGIAKAVYLCETVRHQFDLFHFKRDAGRQIRRLETKAYRLIEEEYQAEGKWQKSQSEESRQEWQGKYQKRREEAEQAIEAFDQAEKAIDMIFGALDLFDADGNFQEPNKCLRNLERGARLLQKASQERKIQNLVEQVLDPHLFLYLSTLQEKLLSFPLRWNKDCPTMTRNRVLKIMARHWYWAKVDNIPVPVRSNESREQWNARKQKAQEELCRIQIATSLEMRQVQMVLANFNEVSQKVNHALNTVFRASSLVESLNSHIRICQQIKKGFSNDFLSLVSLHWNMRPFEGGKRRRSSPFQLLGIQGNHEHWLDFLLSSYS